MVAPGMGNSRRPTPAEIHHHHGVIHSDSLEIDTTGARLHTTARGFETKRPRARHGAIVAHTPVIGQIISTIFAGRKIVDTKSPHAEKSEDRPVWVPKFLLMPLHPIRKHRRIASVR